MFNDATQSSYKDTNLASNNDIQNNIKKASDILNITVTDIPLENVTDETLQMAVEMFTYMNFFPPKLILLYKKLFQNESPKKIILAMASILKASEGPSKESSKKIWFKLKEYLPPLYSQNNDRSFNKTKSLKSRERLS